MVTAIRPRPWIHPGVRVRAVRERRGWTQSEVGRRIRAAGHSYDDVTTWRVERQEFGVKVNTMIMLAEALEVDPAWLCGFRDDPEMEATG